MAKKTAPADLTAEDVLAANEAEGNAAKGLDVVAGVTETQAEAIRRIRAEREKERAVTGGTGPRVIRDYQDAERLWNLKLLTPKEIVDCEERGLFSEQILQQLRALDADAEAAE
jgi:hypothetical protein